MLLSLGFFPATLRGHTENGSKIRRTQRTSQGISTLYATIHAKEVHPCSPSIFVYLDKLPWISIECLMFLYITNWKPQEIQLTTVWDVLRKPCKQWHKNCQPPEFTRFLVAIKSRKRYLLRIRNPPSQRQQQQQLQTSAKTGRRFWPWFLAAPPEGLNRWATMVILKKKISNHLIQMISSDSAYVLY